VLAVGWPIVIALTTVLEPAPADPNAPVQAWESAVAFGFLALAGMAIASSASRSLRAPLWCMAFGGLMLTSVIACPVSGHHAGVGLWWFAQLALTVGMVGVSGVAYHRFAHRD
jgi:hypothetical protein